MAVKMRLRRMGRRNRPFYRLVVADSRCPRDGRFIDMVGHYDPLRDPAEVVIDEEKIMKWLGNGAEMSDTVRSILSKEGVLKKWHESKAGGSKPAEPEVDKGSEETTEPAVDKEATAAKAEATVENVTAETTAEKATAKETEPKTGKKTSKKTEKSQEK